MPRPMVLGLLLACVVSLSSSAVVTENGMPVLWEHTTGLLDDLPKTNEVVAPDPWHYLQRMSLLRMMIAATDPYMSSMGTNATDSPLWGLTVQLGWLLTSGRLADPSGGTTCGLETGDTMCISTESWWSCVNYFSSVMPFMSAAQQGFLGEGVQVKMTVPEGVTDYCTTYDDCAAKYPDVMTKWDDFFKGLLAAKESTATDSEKKDTILGLYWAAQSASSAAFGSCSNRSNHYSSKETNFANSWMDCAEYVSAVYFQSNLDKSESFAKPLPGRILKETDSAPNIADMSAEENHTLYIFSWMTSINSILRGRLVSTWKGAMCSVDAREKGREMLEQLLLNPTYATSSFMSILSLSRSCPSQS